MSLGSGPAVSSKKKGGVKREREREAAAVGREGDLMSTAAETTTLQLVSLSTLV